MRHSGLFLGEFGVGLIGVKCCSHTLLLHAWVSVRRARSHPEPVCGPGTCSLSVRSFLIGKSGHLDGSPSGFDGQVTVRWECAQASRV